MEGLRGIEVEVLVVGGFVILWLVRHLIGLFSTRSRRQWSSYQRPNWPASHARVVTEKPYDRTDAVDQLRSVMAADFFARPIMGKNEYRVFRAVEVELQERWGGYRVFAQTALGEVIGSKDRNAHSAINSKRADFLVIRSNGLPVLAIEYQGDGHYQNDAAARDAVKKEALRKAGVGYFEVFDHHTNEEIRHMVRVVLVRAAVPAN